MFGDISKLRKKLSRIYPVFYRINWINPAFDLDKSYVNAVFSQIAYLHIQKYELAHASLAKIIPCLTYRELISKGIHVDVREILGQMEFGETFVITNKYVVIVGVVTQNVIIISLRGTRLLYLSDWLIDFNISKCRVMINNKNYIMHSGFFDAITECFDELNNTLIKRIGFLGEKIPIYVVGHSLGGAMAAITYALDTRLFYSSNWPISKHYNYNINSSYTYGMPRYGDQQTVQSLSSPYHIYNNTDIVPYVPPKIFGYENVMNEYKLSKDGNLIYYPRDNSRFIDRLSLQVSRIHKVNGIRQHLIENYISNLEKGIS